MEKVPGKMNGLTLYTGSYGARGDNDLVRIFKEYGRRIYFAHLRSIRREESNPLAFHEAAHLEGGSACTTR